MDRNCFQKLMGRRVLVIFAMLMINPLISISSTAETSGRQLPELEIRVIGGDAKTVDRGEVAEYTIEVTNNGEQPVRPDMTSRVNPEHSTYCASSIEPMSELIEAGEAAETTLYVNISATAEVDSTCLATATASTPGAQPVEAETTTTVGDGEPANLFGVEITVDDEKRKRFHLRHPFLNSQYQILDKQVKIFPYHTMIPHVTEVD